MTSNQPAPILTAPTPVGFHEHNHQICVDETLRAVEAYCANSGLRLTAVRRKVLELLLEEHRALGAYAILDKLREAGFGSQPPVAYRALEFLTKHGFAHKIERLSAFVACPFPGQHHTPAFMICRICSHVAETCATQSAAALAQTAKASGFVVERTVVEAEGICQPCSDRASA